MAGATSKGPESPRAFHSLGPGTRRRERMISPNAAFPPPCCYARFGFPPGGFLLRRVCMSSPCLRGFSSGAPAPSHSPNITRIRLSGNSKLIVSVHADGCLPLCVLALWRAGNSCRVDAAFATRQRWWDPTAPSQDRTLALYQRCFFGCCF